MGYLFIEKCLPRNTSSYSVTGTKFFRTNSKKLLKDNPYGNWGTNLQNVGDKVLPIYIPDEGKIFVQVDQAGADALIVAYLLPNGNFRELFLVGIKPHIFVAFHIFFHHWKSLHPELDSSWLKLKPSELCARSSWRTIQADVKRDKRRYFIGKKCCHSFNYRMQPSTFRTDVLKESEGEVILSVKESEYYHETYHSLFPELSQIWWPQIDQQIRSTRTLYNLFGHPLTFHGRVDEKLLREATASVPASTVAIINNTAETELQDWIDENENSGIDLLNNKHDSLLCQCWIGEERLCADLMSSLIQRDLVSPRGERFQMKAEAKVGFNWGERIEKKDEKTGEIIVINPKGLQEISLTT